MAAGYREELDNAKVHRDVRSNGELFSRSLMYPSSLIWVSGVGMVLSIVFAGAWPLMLLVVWVFAVMLMFETFRMPARMPMDIGGLDKTTSTETLRETRTWWGKKGVEKSTHYLPAAGSIYLGWIREGLRRDVGREVWLNSSDARQHMFNATTTGGGKTEQLKALVYSFLCLGQGAVLTDGKAVPELPATMWSIVRRLGRDDDFLCLNFIQGGVDRYQRLVARSDGSLGFFRPPSNNTNPFAEGDVSFLSQLISSLLGVATGDSAKWQQKAIALMSNILNVLAYKRARDGLPISVKSIREHLNLRKLVELYEEALLPGSLEQAYAGIRSYFDTGLPGWNPAHAKNPEKWSPELIQQHGYLTGQFSRLLGLLDDTYGDIFGTQYPEVDAADVLMNNRVLVVLIPSLEKSAEESAALGKLVVSSIRLAMARFLAGKIEGMNLETMKKAQASARFPNPLIFDEVSYYFAMGIAVMYAQARGLNFMMVASVQDKAGLDNSEFKGEVGSMLANSGLKWAGALEDPEATFQIFEKAAAQAYVPRVRNFESQTGFFSTRWSGSNDAELVKESRLDVRELRALRPGQGVMVFRDNLLRVASFYLSPEESMTRKLKVRYNRFVGVQRPSRERLPEDMLKCGPDRTAAGLIFYRQCLEMGEPPEMPMIDDPIGDSTQRFARALSKKPPQELDVLDRMVALFADATTSTAKLRADRPEEISRFWHAPSPAPDYAESRSVPLRAPINEAGDEP